MSSSFLVSFSCAGTTDCAKVSDFLNGSGHLGASVASAMLPPSNFADTVRELQMRIRMTERPSRFAISKVAADGSMAVHLRTRTAKAPTQGIKDAVVGKVRVDAKANKISLMEVPGSHANADAFDALRNIVDEAVTSIGKVYGAQRAHNWLTAEAKRGLSVKTLPTSSVYLVDAQTYERFGLIDDALRDSMSACKVFRFKGEASADLQAVVFDSLVGELPLEPFTPEGRIALGVRASMKRVRADAEGWMAAGMLNPNQFSYIIERYNDLREEITRKA